jgi:ribosomal protein S6--L-glutamate ligase/gamma-F420-2:alpha-L-glutamate ligase
LAELLEATGVPVFNTSTAIRVCDDKALTYIKLKNHRLPTPKTLVLPFTFGQNVIKFYDRIKTLIAEKGFAYPFVLKQRFGSFGEQVYLITSEVMFKKMLQTIGDKELLIQEFIEESSGRDFRVNVVGREAVSIVMRVNQGNSAATSIKGASCRQYLIPTAACSSWRCRPQKRWAPTSPASTSSSMPRASRWSSKSTRMPAR